jgi:transaldolase/glucose-6-phosphate isomerase
MATAATTPLAALQALGQSVWVDFMSRQFVESGELRRLIEEDRLQGTTSNPTIFDKAITHSCDYDDDIRRLVAAGADADAIYQDLTVADIRAALDLFRSTYEQTKGGDGYVSLEVSPLLAHDRDRTAAEARMLWGALDRPNAMIKIPGTPECVPAIEESLAAGININVTLLFSVEAYEEVAHAYVRALKRRADAGQPIDRIASVASFFVSRIDSEVDKRIEAKLKSEADPARRSALEGLLGKIAVANAKNAYASYQRIFDGPEFAPLRAKGAHVQRVLWASVGTKNPKYSDTLYIDELIGPKTVSTMPPATYDAFKDHGHVRPSLTEDMEGARREVERLGELGIDFKDVTDVLLKEGVDSFAKSFDSLMGGIKAKREKLLAESKSR